MRDYNGYGGIDDSLLFFFLLLIILLCTGTCGGRGGCGYDEPCGC